MYCILSTQKCWKKATHSKFDRSVEAANAKTGNSKPKVFKIKSPYLTQWSYKGT